MLWVILSMAKAIKSKFKSPIEKVAPGVIARRGRSTSETGIKSIDSMVPVG